MVKLANQPEKKDKVIPAFLKVRTILALQGNFYFS
jgi:hypothetical protein